MQTEPWVADRAQLQHLLHAHPEWTQKELAAWVGRSLGWVKKWVKRLRAAPEDDISVLFGLPRGRRKPYPCSSAEGQCFLCSAEEQGYVASRNNKVPIRCE